MPVRTHHASGGRSLNCYNGPSLGVGRRGDHEIRGTSVREDPSNLISVRHVAPVWCPSLWHWFPTSDAICGTGFQPVKRAGCVGKRVMTQRFLQFVLAASQRLCMAGRRTRVVSSIVIFPTFVSLSTSGCANRRGDSRDAQIASESPTAGCDSLDIDWVRVEGGGPGGVKSIEISRHEVTHAQYAAFVQATKYDGSDHPSSKPSEPFLASWTNGVFPPGKAAHPVCNVNWHHAQAFCDWLSRLCGRRIRLPSNAEWTWAARGAAGRKYPWGNTWDPKRCNWGDNGAVDGFAESAPVGAFPAGATPEGVLDMAGNIWEWTAERHLRGGPWCLAPERLQSDQIAEEDPERADDKFGFRVVREIAE